MIDFSEFPAYDEVHVISDLHMGGKPGFQILRETHRLAGFIGWVAGQSPAGKVALVLNGDVFDTLAEDIPDYVAVDRAVETVRRIMDDPAFSVIWDALAAYVKVERRTLVFVIGNHDIELAFPVVQNLILWRLAGEDMAQRGRIVFSTTGAGYTCTVGNAKVYCTHGNEVDAWNYNRYEDLAKVSRRLNAGRTLSKDEWTPNAGTRMVKDVMNEVKKTYKWIDLLKPEASAAVGTLIVLDPSQAAKITKLLPIVGEKIKAGAEVDQRLSAEGYQTRDSAGAPSASLDQLLGPNLRASLRNATEAAPQAVDDMLMLAEKNLGQKDARIVQPEAALGTGELILDRLTGWITGVSKEEALRRALQDWLKDDRTFDSTNRDETFNEITANVGNGIDFIVTGHTHLERAIAMDGNRFYFNCGTWIRLLRITGAMLKDTDSFKPVYNLLINKSGVMELIDKATFTDESGTEVPFVLDQTSAVSIRREGDKVFGRLVHVEKDGTGEPSKIVEFVR